MYSHAPTVTFESIVSWELTVRYLSRFSLQKTDTNWNKFVPINGILPHKIFSYAWKLCTYIFLLRLKIVYVQYIFRLYKNWKHLVPSNIISKVAGFLES